MLDFNFTKAEWLVNSEGIWITLQVPERLKNQTQDFILGIKNAEEEKVYHAEIKPFRKKRSLDSNSYAWVLINEIANVLRASKEEIYLSMLKSYGQSSVVSVVEEAVEMFMASVKYREEVGRAELNGKKFVHVKVYKGSSDFDSREMAILIDGIISEAEELGISTITPAEAERMKGAWGNG